MKYCPYCYQIDEIPIEPHYTKHKTNKGDTWIAYCPKCGKRTPYYRGGKPKTLEQAKMSWEAYDLIGTVCLDDVPMQTFSPD